MESIMAIVVISITAGAMIPPLFVAAATRVQTRRAEQALQIAQGEVDRIRALIEQSPRETFDTILPPDQYGGSIIEVGAMEAVGGPENDFGACRSTNSASNTYEGERLTNADQYLAIDTDGDALGNDCNADFIMQTFRSESTQDSQLHLGVRVYAGNAIKTLANGGTLKTDEAGLKFTTGAGQQLDRPLAVLFTKISASNRSGIDSMCLFQNHADCP